LQALKCQRINAAARELREPGGCLGEASLLTTDVLFLDGQMMGQGRRRGEMGGEGMGWRLALS